MGRGGDKVPAFVFEIFDLIYLDGYSLTRTPLRSVRPRWNSCLPLRRSKGPCVTVITWKETANRFSNKPASTASKHCFQTSGIPLRVNAKPKLAEDEVHKTAGVRDRRVHTFEERLPRFWIAYPGSLRKRKTDLLRQGWYRLSVSNSVSSSRKT